MSDRVADNQLRKKPYTEIYIRCSLLFIVYSIMAILAVSAITTFVMILTVIINPSSLNPDSLIYPYINSPLKMYGIWLLAIFSLFIGFRYTYRDYKSFSDQREIIEYRNNVMCRK